MLHAFEKCGEDSFEITVEKIMDAYYIKQDLIDSEQRTIDLYQSFDQEKGFNLRRYAYSSLGSKWTEETREKMRISRIGRVISETAKANISKALKGKICSPKRIESLIQGQSHRRVPVLQLDLEGNILKVWESSRLAAEGTGFNKNSIYLACKQNFKYKGFVWKQKKLLAD